MNHKPNIDIFNGEITVTVPEIPTIKKWCSQSCGVNLLENTTM
jgi:hypothetical protein